MKKVKNSRNFLLRRRYLLGLSTSVASCAGFLALAGAHNAEAFTIYDGSNAGNNWEVNLTTTVTYSAFERVNNPSEVLINPANANGSEGDLNFQHGIVSNEFSVLPVFDATNGDFGAHLSGEMYLNTVYLQKNQNDQPDTFNPLSTTDYQSFTSATRNVNGQNARFLDAFVYGKATFGDGQTLRLKLGKQTLLWGESLFFANNGISAGQAPLDIQTAQSLPNPEAQQIFLPVAQAVLTYRPNIGDLVLQGYYQFEYEHDNFQGVGAYFNSADFFDKGGQRLILGPGEYLSRIKDLTPPNQNGDFGLSAQDTFGNYDVGLYGLRYDSKAPTFYVHLGPGAGTPTPGGIFIGNYQVVYPRDIQIYGASLSTTVGPANVAGEISTRRNMNLVGGLAIAPPDNPGNASSDPLYPVGNTLQAQASVLDITSGIPLDPGGLSIDGEVEFNHLLSVTENRSALAPGRQASAAAVEVVVTPTYYDVLPSLEITFPIGITYNFLGRSEIDQTMQHGTGAFTLGITGTYNTNWIASLTYKDYLGKPDATYNALADRGYVALNLQTSF